ncbi:MAG: geranylgeranyl reductase family protein [Thermodesulfobacteriota bacterium]
MDARSEVLVVGGGPAGAEAARAAAESGASVLLIEAKRRFGEWPHCAEYVPRLLARETAFPSRGVVQAVEAMETFVDGRSVVTPAPGFILDRGVFDHGLALAAAAAGAELWAGVRLIRIQDEAFVFRGSRGEETVRAGAVVAADGAGSTVRRLLGLPAPARLTGIQVEVPLAAPLSRTLVFFTREYRHGYAWLFPKGGAANLGVGMREDAPGRARSLLGKLAQDLIARGLTRPGVLARSAGAIGISGPPARLSLDRVLFTGDAAGLTHPVTGAGLPQAAFSGRAAGLAAVRLVRGDRDAPAQYENEVRDRYGRALAWAVAKRKMIEESWDEEDFAGLVQKTWPAFPEYRNAP